jgi:L-seryl-tRNA(Ser) seleniumtransferase
VSDPKLASLPAIHALADDAHARGQAPRWACLDAARRLVAARREQILRGVDGANPDAQAVAALAGELARPSLRRVVNATGVVLHTNLGRAPLPAAARAAIDEVAGCYANLEYDLARGERGSRHDHLRAMLCALAGAEDALVCNNNAAAIVLGLAALAGGKQVVVSRGELVEIGGSFRLPEILALSAATLCEVGTTNKTHRADYERSIHDGTGLLLKVHRSNFAIVGFTSEVSVDDVVTIGRARGLPTMIDLGSGMLIDRATQRRWGLPDEPTVAEAVASGAAVVTFSGDKLLGGPQAGIAVGSRAAIEVMRKHPLMRVLRPGKLAIAGLAATLALYRDGRADEIPAIAMMARGAEDLRASADELAVQLRIAAPGLQISVEPCTSTVGGGAMPTAELPSFAVTLAGQSADQLDARLRAARVPVVGRIAEGRVWLDMRTLVVGDAEAIADAVRSSNLPAFAL